MKAQKTTQDPVVAPVDSNLISAITDLVSRLRSASADFDKHQKAGYDHHIICERFLRDRGAVFAPGKPASVLLADCHNAGYRNDDVRKLSAAMDAKAAEYAEAETCRNDAETVEAELKELLRVEGSAFDARILAAHKALVAEIAERLRPECENDEEALTVARGMARPTLLHSKLYSWKHGESTVIRAENFLRCVASCAVD